MWLWLIPVYCHLVFWAIHLWLSQLCPSFSLCLVWFSCLVIFYLAIGQGILYYQQMGSAHIQAYGRSISGQKIAQLLRDFSISLFVLTQTRRDWKKPLSKMFYSMHFLLVYILIQWSSTQSENNLISLQRNLAIGNGINIITKSLMELTAFLLWFFIRKW